MWPTPHVEARSDNPFPFFPFNPHWAGTLPLPEYETFCTLLRLAWVSPRPCYLPAGRGELNCLLAPHGSSAAPVSDAVLRQFEADPRTGLLYFPPQLKALERLVEGENMYALLWDEL
jgi:hypothetical protein